MRLANELQTLLASFVPHGLGPASQLGHAPPPIPLYVTIFWFLFQVQLLWSNTSCKQAAFSNAFFHDCYSAAPLPSHFLPLPLWQTSLKSLRGHLSRMSPESSPLGRMLLGYSWVLPLPFFGRPDQRQWMFSQGVELVLPEAWIQGNLERSKWRAATHAFLD